MAEQQAGLVVHAALVLRDGAVANMDEAALDAALAPKAAGLAALVEALERTAPAGHRRLSLFALFSSTNAFTCNPGQANYCASKAGVHGFTRAMAVDLGRDGIRCNAIAPGWINSDLSHAYIDAQPDPAQARAGLLKLHPVGRTGEPQDIGNVVVFLASEAAAFITGQVLVVDGGRTAKLPLPF